MAGSEIMTARELANYLRLHETTIYKLAQEGTIPGVRIGRVWRFKREAIEELLKEGTGVAPMIAVQESELSQELDQV